MIVNLTVFIYEPLYWRVTVDVVFVALFPLNRRLFNEIVAYQELFCMVTLLASSSNHDDGEGNMKIKKNMRQVSLVNRKKTWTCSALFGKFPCHCRTSDVLKLYRNGSAIVPLAPVQTYPDIFESANCSLRIQKFPRPHVSGFKSNLPVHTYPDSPSFRQLICKAIFGSREDFIASLFHR